MVENRPEGFLEKISKIFKPKTRKLNPDGQLSFELSDQQWQYLLDHPELDISASGVYESILREVPSDSQKT